MDKKEFKQRQNQNIARLATAIIGVLIFIFLVFELVATDSVSIFGYFRFVLVLVWPSIFSILFWKFMVEERKLKDLNR